MRFRYKNCLARTITGIVACNAGAALEIEAVLVRIFSQITLDINLVTYSGRFEQARQTWVIAQ